MSQVGHTTVCKPHKSAEQTCIISLSVFYIQEKVSQKTKKALTASNKDGIIKVSLKRHGYKMQKGGDMLNKNILEAEMKLHGDTGQTLADYLGIARSTFSQKLNENGTEFTKHEIALIKQRYRLTPKKIDAIFFDKKVSK